jgi:hypothetical protein
MLEELSFKDKAATEYDRAFGHVTMHFMPFLLRAAQAARGATNPAIHLTKSPMPPKLVAHSAGARRMSAGGTFS